MTERAAALSKTRLSSLFLTTRDGIRNTEVPSSGTSVSQSQHSLQTACSRVPLLTLNSAMLAK